jgi:hypothetical protein
MGMKDIYSHTEISAKEGFSLQRGMNYRPQNKKYSIFLMSLTDDSPYNDGFSKNNDVLFYEGEDVTKREKVMPKQHDQPMFTKTGKLTNNGKFFKAAEAYKLGRRKTPEKIKIYEKITNNVWSDKGYFYLVDAKYIYSEEEQRKVFKFILEPEEIHSSIKEEEDLEFSRRIPTDIKRIVWERYNCQCTKCGATENLHFDHVIPYSKGGSSTDPKNIEILCEKHNLKKSDKIV